MQGTALLIFSALFFLAAFGFSYHQNNILSNVGKVLNPLFLSLLFLAFLVAFARPLGNPQTAAVTAAYKHGALVSGFLEGYNHIAQGRNNCKDDYKEIYNSISLKQW